MLLSALAATHTSAQNMVLPSKTYRYEDLPVRGKGPNHSRQILKGETHAGFALDLHETELAPAQAPHPPHHHVHEEMLLIRDGTLEVAINDRSTTLGPGSVAYMASNEEHGLRNAGPGRARYYILALGRDSA